MRQRKALAALAALLDEPGFDAELRARHAAGGGSLAQLRARLAEERLPGAAALLAGPNNSLGIAYLRAVRRLGLPLQALALPREGAAHDAPLPARGTAASAGALRGRILAGDLAALRPYVPAKAFALYEKEAASGAVLDERAFSPRCSPRCAWGTRRFCPPARRGRGGPAQPAGPGGGAGRQRRRALRPAEKQSVTPTPGCAAWRWPPIWA